MCVGAPHNEPLALTKQTIFRGQWPGSRRHWRVAEAAQQTLTRASEHLSLQRSFGAVLDNCLCRSATSVRVNAILLAVVYTSITASQVAAGALDELDCKCVRDKQFLAWMCADIHLRYGIICNVNERLWQWLQLLQLRCIASYNAAASLGHACSVIACSISALTEMLPLA
jgi:hypothetical protein